MKKLKDRVLALDNSEASNDCILVGEDGMESLVSGNPQSLKFKLLQFQENHRPPYWGTWRKQSKWVSARRPFGKDKVCKSLISNMPHLPTNKPFCSLIVILPPYLFRICWITKWIVMRSGRRRNRGRVFPVVR
jgi:hypothetical protein